MRRGAAEDKAQWLVAAEALAVLSEATCQPPACLPHHCLFALLIFPDPLPCVFSLSLGLPCSSLELPLPGAAAACALPFSTDGYCLSWHRALLYSAGVVPLCPLMCCTPPLRAADGGEPWLMIKVSVLSSAAAAWPSPWDFQVGNPLVLLWAVAQMALW